MSWGGAGEKGRNGVTPREVPALRRNSRLLATGCGVLPRCAEELEAC